MTTSPLLLRLADLAALDAPALEAADGACSHRQLAARSAAVARSLLSGRASLDGARVALLAAPSIAWVAGFLGVIRAGGVVVPLAPSHPEAELRYIASDAAPEAILLDAAHAGRAALFAPSRPVSLDEPGDGVYPEVPDMRATDDALMLYTSGTTGKPKGARLTHGNLEAQARLIASAWGITASDRLLHALPLHHMHGVVIALLTTLLAGGSATLLPRFDAAAVWDGLAGATVWMAVPTMAHKLLETHDQADDERRARWTAAARGLRLATSGSAALPATLAARWSAVAGAIPLERFGMTEVGVALSNPLRGERRPGSVGLPLPGVEVRVVDESGRDVAPGEPGEIVVRGPTVFAGYHGREDATRASFRDGWFLTGDTATVEAGGYVKILGRTSVDILKSGGYKLSALEIEEALREHPAVAEVAVVGLPDEVWGERVAAVVVVRGGLTQGVTADELRSFCRERLAPYKAPREVFFVDELPRNALGKVLKPELLRRLRGQP